MFRPPKSGVEAALISKWFCTSCALDARFSKHRREESDGLLSLPGAGAVSLDKRPRGFSRIPLRTDP